MTFIFATANTHKAAEIQAMVPEGITIQAMSEVGIHTDIPEPFDTLSENAATKAEFVFNIVKTHCFAEDTGLEIDALNGLPGVLSARFAGAEKNPQANMHKVLDLLQGQSNRKAQFRTIIHAIIQGKPVQFEGIVRGEIAEFPIGTGGFGYDPIFIPEGYSNTFGELPSDVKQAISHRARAFQEFMLYLERQM